MFEILLCDTPQQQLSNYGSLYELFAGLSAALTGVEALRVFLLKKLKKKFSKVQSEIIESIAECDAFCKEFTEQGNEGDEQGAAHEKRLSEDRER